MPLLLRRVSTADQAAFELACQMPDFTKHTFALGRKPNQTFADYFKQLCDHEMGISLPAGFVPATYLCGFVDGQIIGRLSLRHELNDYLLQVGGHIGYMVLPEFRRRGYATEMLRQSLPIAKSIGLNRVLLTCDDDNVGSIKTIEACGGELENIYDGQLAEGIRKRRYWIQIK